MKLNLLVLAVTICLGLAATAWLQAGTPPAAPEEEPSKERPAGDALPAFTMTDLDGDMYQSSDFAGKTLVINFWATWCPPCIVEFPRLLQIARTYPEHVVLLAISSDQNPEAIERFIDIRLGPEGAAAVKQANVHIVHDEQSRITFDIFQTAMLPETIIVSPEQQMVHKLVGVDWIIEDLKPFLPAAPAAEEKAP